jgi:para-nitrobenzyl esterase
MSIVAVAQGKLQGEEKYGVFRFLGVPFAAPPVGTRRFKAPAPAESWDGTREATRYGPVCPQNPSPLEALLGAREPYEQDEDCLTLNIWTPSPGADRLPVMVWIHGGAFTQGTGRAPWYDGTAFARRGVVCVTINYRLGPLGFLYTGDTHPRSGNAGILDQSAALRWVQDNISAFGGDPGNVTIFGESAGGMSVGTLLALPDAKGTFHKAIPQSGAAHNSMTPDIASRVTQRFVREAGVGSQEELQNVPVQKILEAAASVGALAFTTPLELFGSEARGIALPFQPVVDGDALPERPIDVVRAGGARDIAVLVGTCADEWRLFTALMPEGSPARRPHGVDEDVVAAYQAARPDASDLDVFSAVETDRVFRIPAVRLAEVQSENGAPTYMYLFAWRSPAMDGRLGACHALELPFVFDTLDAPGIPFLAGNAPPPELAKRMNAAWASFAATGDPGWPRYDTAMRTTKVFDVDDHLEDDPSGDERRLWDGVL